MHQMTTEIAYAPATELAERIRRGEIGSRELLLYYLDRIAEVGEPLNAVVTLDRERALRYAGYADDAVVRGELWGTLHGVPVTVKDIIETARIRTTAGSRDLADYVPPTDAVAVRRLREAGAIVFGKTNLPAHAADAQTYNDVFGTTNNPWDLTRTTGGSSGGSAAAVAAGLTSLDLGSDMGGSIRHPASTCGVFGLRPSSGAVPMGGHLVGRPGILSEVDGLTIGPLARSAADLELALDVMAGPAPRDGAAWSLGLPTARATSLGGLRIAAWLDDPHCPVDREVRDVLEAAVEEIRSGGTTVDPDARPADLGEVDRLFQQVCQPLFSPAYPPDVFEQLRALAATGGDAPPVRHARNVTATVRDHCLARERRAQLGARVRTFFADIDLIVCPITPMTAIRHDQRPDVDARRITVNGEERPYGEQFGWLALASLLGLPSAAVPVGRTASGLPVGLQVIGPRWEDRTVLAAAGLFETVLGGFVPPPPWS